MKAKQQYKTAMRLGASVFPKTMGQKFAIAQERRSKGKQTRGKRGQTEYGKQLLEKQKIKVTYGVSERQFRIYVREAMESHGKNPADVLHEMLERRLDNIIYRLGVAPTRRGARQMVSHGHITIDGVRTTVPSRRVYIGDTIAIRDGSKNGAFIQTISERLGEMKTPSWLTFDVKNFSGKMTDLPTKDNADAAGDIVAVLSFYSR